MKITFYNDFDDLWDDLEKSRIEADSKVTEWQKKLTVGDHFIKDSGYGFPIFGEVLNVYTDDQRLQHYRFCECYSVACPDGEKGDVHVSTIQSKIEKIVFEEMREKGWSLE